MNGRYSRPAMASVGAVRLERDRIRELRMFWSQRKSCKKSTRRRARAGGSMSLPRLGVESMERRLMLSATIGAMPTVQVAMIDSSTLSRTFILGSLSPTDGGFIVINGSDSNGIVRAVNNNGIGVSGFADQDGTPLSLDYRWDLLNTGQAVGKPDLQQLYGDQSANLDIGTFN